MNGVLTTTGEGESTYTLAINVGALDFTVRYLLHVSGLSMVCSLAPLLKNLAEYQLKQN